MNQRPTRSKETGQWALGQRDPLNPNEQFKAEDDGLNVRARIEQIYAKEGFASIPAEDLRGRMRWWGLYTQRRPGIDGGRTASLPPEELDDEYFMLRIRSDGGMLSLDQVRAIVASADSLPALQAAIGEAFAALPIDDLTRVMEIAFAAAQLAGRADVAGGG